MTKDMSNEQASMLWTVLAEVSTEHQIELLIDMFGEEQVKVVFKEDYDEYKKDEDEEDEDEED
jgi:hypothetical protein